jgi:hypothetical protein
MSGDCEWLWVWMATVSVIYSSFFFFPFHLNLNSAQQYPSQDLREIFFLIKNQTETNTYNISVHLNLFQSIIDKTQYFDQ